MTQSNIIIMLKIDYLYFNIVLCSEGRYIYYVYFYIIFDPFRDVYIIHELYNILFTSDHACTSKKVRLMSWLDTYIILTTNDAMVVKEVEIWHVVLILIFLVTFEVLKFSVSYLFKIVLMFLILFTCLYSRFQYDM